MTPLNFNMDALRTMGLSIVPPGADLPELASIDVVLYCAADPSPAAQLFKDLLLEITLPTLAQS